jgi:hypothetical protein
VTKNSSYEWVAQAAPWLTEKLTALRLQNDGVGLTEAQTQALRGEIRLVKLILDLPNRELQDAKNKAQETAP